MKQIFTLLIAVFLFIASSPCLNAQVNVIDSIALVNLYKNTNGDNWTNHNNWLTSTPVSSWYGIKLDQNNNVVNIILYNNNLTGNLPSSLGNIANLDTLELGRNHLSGNIPASLGSLGKLTFLDLMSNEFTFTGLEQLTLLFSQKKGITLYLFNQSAIPIHHNVNSLSVSMGGTLSAISFTWMLNGSILTISQGDSTLAITSLGTYSVTAYDSIAKQFLYSTSYSLSTKANTTDSLALIDLYNNTKGANWNNNSGWLKSPLSNWYGVQLDNSGRVSAINLTFNNLIGVLPTTLGNLNNLQQLQLQSNHLLGIVPVSLAGLKNLSTLDVSYNYYTFGGLESIAKSYTKNNSSFFYLPQDTIIPIRQKGNLLSVSVGGTPNHNSYTWYFNNNLFSTAYGDSTIKPTVSGIYSVTIYDSSLSLYLQSANDSIFLYTKPNVDDSLALVDLYNSTGGADWINKRGWVKGTVSNWYGVVLDSLGRVTELNLPLNNLFGTLPSSLNKMSNLKTLQLNNNHLMGNVPMSVSLLNNISYLDISYNYYTFGDLEPIAKYFLANDYTFNYSPQDTLIPIRQNGDLLSVSFGGTNSVISYTWFLNGSVVYTVTGDSTYKPTTTGVYFVRAYDSKAGLTLFSATDTIRSILPIKAINLNAKLMNREVLLQWQTIGESNTISFTIQHSNNSSDFTDIETIESFGSGSNRYSLVAKEPVIGVNFYRIKSIDKQGVISYSQIERVQFEGNSSRMSVFPNPVQKRVVIFGEKISRINVVDNFGKIVYTQFLKNATNPVVETNNLARGIYNLLIQTTDDKTSCIRLIKE